MEVRMSKGSQSSRSSVLKDLELIEATGLVLPSWRCWDSRLQFGNSHWLQLAGFLLKLKQLLMALLIAQPLCSYLYLWMRLTGYGTHKIHINDRQKKNSKRDFQHAWVRYLIWNLKNPKSVLNNISFEIFLVCHTCWHWYIYTYIYVC